MVGYQNINKTHIIMEYRSDKKKYVCPEVTVTLWKFGVKVLTGSSELGKDVFIEEDEEEKDNEIFG